MTNREGRSAALEDVVEGPLTVARKGFGFIAHPAGDVFVPRQHLGGAWHGDRVRAVAVGTERGRTGRVVEVVRRATSRIVGVLHATRKGAWVEPDDERAGPEVLVRGPLPPEAEGLVVGVDLTEHPRRAGEAAGGRVVRVFGRRGSARDETAALLWREDIAPDFPPEVEAEAREVAAAPPPVAGREDLRHLALITIDPADARDHDDALFAEPLADGTTHLVVAIADVSAHVPGGGAMDREARRRGCTLYLPDRTLPMLPMAISAGVASLVPDEDRLALVLDARLGADGAVLDHRLVEGVIRSRRRLTYEDAAQLLAADARGPGAGEHAVTVSVLRDLAAARRATRAERGSLQFVSGEVKVEIDPACGQPRALVRRAPAPDVAEAYGLVEEAMLFTNELVSAELERRGLPTIFRVHTRPEAPKLAELTAAAGRLGIALEPTLFDDPRAVAIFLDGLAGDAADVLRPLVLEAMPRAAYTDANTGHFALAAASYTHFTSPIRRYPDLLVQRLLVATLRGSETPALDALADLNHLAKRATRLVRELVALHGAILLRDHIGESFTGVVTGVGKAGLHVALDQPAADVFCPVEMLPDGPWDLRAEERRLVGQGHAFTVGDRGTFKVESTLVGRRVVIASLTGVATTK